jgi:hypothetical protein
MPGNGFCSTTAQPEHLILRLDPNRKWPAAGPDIVVEYE